MRTVDVFLALTDDELNQLFPNSMGTRKLLRADITRIIAENAAAGATTAAAPAQSTTTSSGAGDDDSHGNHHDGTTAAPAARCFKRAPPLPLADAVCAAMSMPSAPPGRPDLVSIVPDADDVKALLDFLDANLASLKARPQVQRLIAACKLSDDDVKVLLLYKLEHPYPFYRWLNGWLQCNRRDASAVNSVGPIFTLLYRAMEKLPKVASKAARAVIVRNIPALRATFDGYRQRLAAGMPLSFWSFASFSTDDDVVNEEAFIGKANEDAIVFMCAEVQGVDMEPFKPQGMPSEKEILPLCPAVFEVVVASKVGSKLTVALKQLAHGEFSYVVPSSS
jgi:hypothetical protein